MSLSTATTLTNNQCTLMVSELLYESLYCPYDGWCYVEAYGRLIESLKSSLLLLLLRKFLARFLLHRYSAIYDSPYLDTKS